MWPPSSPIFVERPSLGSTLAKFVGVAIGAGAIGLAVHHFLAPSHHAARWGAWVPPPAPSSPRAQPVSQPPPLSAQTTDHVDVNTPAAAVWGPIIIGHAIAAGVNPNVAMAWAAAESAFNPCAVGARRATGADSVRKNGGPLGFDPSKYDPGDMAAPQEVGIFQLYNPDDFIALGAHASELVAYCVRPAPGQVNPQKLSRPMTADEMTRHVQLGIAKIKRAADKTAAVLASVGARWDRNSPDFWSMVKSVHALLTIEGKWLPIVAQRLGRAPASWREFRSTLEEIEPSARYSAELAAAGQDQPALFRSLRNAEIVGSHARSERKVA